MAPKQGRFRSKAQWRWAFANKMPFAQRWAHRTTGTTARGTTKGKRVFHGLPNKRKGK